MIFSSAASIGALATWAGYNLGGKNIGGNEMQPPSPPPLPNVAPIRFVDYETLKLMNDALDEVQKTRADLNHMAKQLIFYKRIESVLSFVAFVSSVSVIAYYM